MCNGIFDRSSGRICGWSDNRHYADLPVQSQRKGLGMKVAYYEVGKDMEVREIGEDLESMRKLVDGNIDIMGHDKVLGLLYIVNKDGHCIPGIYKPNRIINNGGYTIMGNFFVAKANGFEIVGLDDEDIYKLMAADMTVEQIMEMDRLYRELCVELNNKEQILYEAKKMLEENCNNIKKCGYENSYPMGRAMGTIMSAIEILNGSVEEKKDVKTK